jgi:preprotein translocase subunit SecG
MLLNILLVILVIDCIALIAVILMQRSEGGALGMGGGPSGMFTARGAGDLLTRTTSILVAVLFTLSMAITLFAGQAHKAASLTQRMKVNPIDLSTLANGSSAPAAAASSAPAAPSLPTAPPLPGAAPPLPSAAPLPTLSSPTARPSAKPRASAPATTSAAPPPLPSGPAPAGQSPAGQ